MKVQGEIYGKSCYIREYVQGECSHEDCNVAMPTWDLAVKELNFGLAGELDPEPRLAKIAELGAAQDELRTRMRAMYQKAQLEAQDVTQDQNSKPVNQKQSKKKAKFYDEMARSIDDVQSIFANTTFVSTAEVRQARVTGLYMRDADGWAASFLA